MKDDHSQDPTPRATMMKQVEQFGQKIIHEISTLQMEDSFDSVFASLNVRDDYFNNMKDLLASTVEVSPLSSPELDTLSIIVRQNLEIETLIRQRQLHVQSVLQGISGVEQFIRSVPEPQIVIPRIDIES